MTSRNSGEIWIAPAPFNDLGLPWRGIAYDPGEPGCFRSGLAATREEALCVAFDLACAYCLEVQALALDLVDDWPQDGAPLRGQEE